MRNSIKRSMMVISLISVLFIGALVPKDVALAASGDTIVYITKTGGCYHADGCSGLRKSKIAISLQDAIKRNYTACSNCHPVTLDATTATTNTAAVQPATATATTPATAVAADPAVEALKTYKGNTKEFNAYFYYMNYADLRTAIGANGDALLKHYTDNGKAENRIAKELIIKK